MDIFDLAVVVVEFGPGTTAGRVDFWQHMASLLSAPIHVNGNILAAIFCPTGALGVEWIRSLIFLLDKIYRINGIIIACGGIPLGRRPFYPDNPVDPV